MMRSFCSHRWIPALLLPSILGGCAIARPLVPLKEGELRAELALPAALNEAPFFPVGSPVIGLRAGVSRGAELRVTFQPVHLFLEHRPILGIGTGAIFHLSPAEAWIPAVHFTSDLTMFAPVGGGRGPEAIIAGDAAVIAHWEPLSWLFPYVLFGAAAASHQSQPLTSLYAGLQLWPGGVVECSLEAGWFAFSVDGDEITQPLIGPSRGVLYLGGALAVRLGSR
jgi:hypothetical protein